MGESPITRDIGDALPRYFCKTFSHMYGRGVLGPSSSYQLCKGKYEDTCFGGVLIVLVTSMTAASLQTVVPYIRNQVMFKHFKLIPTKKLV